MIAQTLKALDFLLKKFVLTTVVFLHTQKDSEGASIHRIDELFPLKPSLIKNLTHKTHLCFTRMNLKRIGTF